MIRLISLTIIVFVGITLSVAADEEPKTGATVLFKYGRGIEKEHIAKVVQATIEQGCPAKSDPSGRPKRVQVYAAGKNFAFSEVSDAGEWALKRCKSVSVSPVTILIGPGTSDTKLANVVPEIEYKGCPVTIREDFIPKTITVKVGKKFQPFDEAKDAMSWAIHNCIQSGEEVVARIRFEFSIPSTLKLSEKIAEELERCKSGYDLSCYNAALGIFASDNKENNTLEAGIFIDTLFLKSCKSNVYTCSFAIENRRFHNLRNFNDNETLSMAQRDCIEAKGRTSCFVLGILLWDGRGTDVDRLGSLAALERGCDLGEERACKLLQVQRVILEKEKEIQKYDQQIEAANDLLCILNNTCR